MQRATERATDEAQITDLLAAFSAAIREKNTRAAVALYTRDVVGYDLAPPLRIAGSTMRDPRYIQQWFDTWDGPIESEARDLEIVTEGDVAYAFGLRHMTGTKKDGEHVDLWFRATACLRREEGTWKIAHVHNSVPFAMDGSDRALLDLEP
jgi:ketosteroid isomerase-like protein